MALLEIRRGDVVVVRLDPTRGAEKRGTRPCLVVQNDMGNRHSPLTIVVPVTDAAGKRVYPFQALLHKGEGGLKKGSIAACDQVRVIARTRITAHWGSLPPARMAEVDQALRRSLAL